MVNYLVTIREHSVWIHTHTHPFNGPFSGTTQVNRYQKGKPIWILLNQETVSGSGISWAICKSTPCSRQTTTPAPHHSVFYRPDALPATQPTVSKHWKHMNIKVSKFDTLHSRNFIQTKTAQQSNNYWIVIMMHQHQSKSLWLDVFCLEHKLQVTS